LLKALTCPRGSIAQHTLGWINSQGYKLFRMKHRQLHNLSHLVNLLLAATDVTVSDIWLLLHSHHGDTCINLGRKRDLDLILGTVHSTAQNKAAESMQCRA